MFVTVCASATISDQRSAKVTSVAAGGERRLPHAADGPVPAHTTRTSHSALNASVASCRSRG